jgi:transposase
LDGSASFIAEGLATGNRNAVELFPALKAKGFRGGDDAVRRFVSKRIGSTGRPGRRVGPLTPPTKSAPTSRRLSFRVVNPKPEGHSAKVRNERRARNPPLDGWLRLFEELLAMLRRQTSTTLADWTARARASGSPELANLAESLSSDATAVEAAMTQNGSNGPVEGQVNRLKTIKRQMYGRAGIHLLKVRVTHQG